MRLRTGHMTPTTPLLTVTLPLSAVTLPPSALTHGNVTIIKGRQPTHAPGTTSHSSSRSQGANTGKRNAKPHVDKHGKYHPGHAQKPCQETWMLRL